MNDISRTNDPSTDAVPVAASSVGGSRRLSDSERATALDALGAHLSEGRIDVAEFDPLRAEGEDYASALRDAGVPVETYLAEGQMHIFFQMYNVLPGYEDGMSRAADWINRSLSDTP